ncbi:TPA: DUF4435 domain-containing protein [Aeromonas veronii]|nr:DUF4435 domain-containing protein [Aeromonas veronii]
MEDDITPARIANSILQETDFQGFNLLVEGETDIKLYKKFTTKDNCKIKVTFGKQKLHQVFDILREREFNKVVGIRDADFLRLNYDGSYIPDYVQDIFITDTHDAEGMIIKSNAFSDFLYEIAKDNHIIAFTNKYGCIKDYLYRLSYPIACLRLANKMFNLGLFFKPKNQDGNTIKYKKFICEKSLTYLGHDVLINTIVEYSNNRGSKVSDRKKILSHLEQTINSNYDINEIINGHDLAEILCILCNKGLKSSHENIKSAPCVESMLRLSYSKEHFSSSQLYRDLQSWQEEKEINVFEFTKQQA